MICRLNCTRHLNPRHRLDSATSFCVVIVLYILLLLLERKGKKLASSFWLMFSKMSGSRNIAMQAPRCYIVKSGANTGVVLGGGST